jgi:predicted membrane protein
LGHELKIIFIMEHNQTQKRFLIGLVILALGTGLLLSNLGILNYEIKRYILRWEMILIALGLIFIVSQDSKVPGIILLIIGGFLYSRDFINLNFNFWQIFWPIMLILAGVLILFRKRIDAPSWEKKSVDTEDLIDEIAVFGGADKTIMSQNFKGGKILAIFGGSSFNMARAKLAPGKNYIEVLAIFGGMKLIVPEDWNIKISAVSIFGGFTDKHRIQSYSGNPESELVIKGIVIFGGGEIRSF